MLDAPNARHMARLIALVPAGMAIGSLLEWAVARRAPASLHVDFSQPLAVATAWHATGLWLLAALAVGAAIAAIGYIATIARLSKARPARPRLLLVVLVTACALGVLAAFFAPVMLSSDVYAYATYGEMALRGIDPYSHAKLATSDPMFAATIWQWSNPPPVCVYGPLFVAISKVVVHLTNGLGVARQLDALRLLSMLAMVACVPLAYAAFAPLGKRAQAIAAVAIGLNPIALWSAADGHNDTLMLAMVLAGAALLQRFGVGIATAIVALSASIKAPGAIAAIAFAFAQRARGTMAAWAGAILGLGLVAWWSFPAIGDIAVAAAHGNRSLPSISLWAIGSFTPIVVAGLLLVAGIGALMRREIDGWILLALAVWSAMPNPYPWYGLWFLPTAALAPRSRAAAVVVALSFTTTLRYLPDVYGTLAAPAPFWLSLLAFAPLLALLRRKPDILSDPV